MFGSASAAMLVLALGCGSSGGGKKSTDAAGTADSTSGTGGSDAASGSDATATGGADTTTGANDTTVTPIGDTSVTPGPDVVITTPDTSQPDMDVVGPTPDTNIDSPDTAAGACEVTAEMETFFTTKCGPGCHTGGAKNGGVNLDPSAILTGGAIVPGNSSAGAVAQAINNGTMPPGGPLTADQKKALFDWIDSLDCGGSTTDPGVDNGPAVGLPAGCAIAGAEVDCNALTNSGCPAAGEACDLNETGGLSCFPPPNDVAAGGTCSNAEGPFCMPGLHCGEDGTCHAFCCANSDCSGGTCTPFDATLGSIGVCM
jgi:hypothetical protein